MLYILMTTKLMEYSEAIYAEHEHMALAILQGGHGGSRETGS
jgi:hypothetical protein